MIIPAATLAVLFSQCAPQVAPDTLSAIIRTESGGNPFVINNITDKEVRYFDSLEQAASYGNDLLKKGNHFSAGLMQIYSGNFSWLDITDTAQVFDPCTNIKAGATILTKNYLSLKGDEQSRLRKALSIYYSGNPKNGFIKEGKTSYVERVENNAFSVPSLKPSLNSSPVNNKKFPSWDLFKDYSYEETD